MKLANMATCAALSFGRSCFMEEHAAYSEYDEKVFKKVEG